MMPTRKSARIQKTIEFLERVARDGDKHHSCVGDGEEDMRGRKLVVVDRERPVYYWHWQVHKQKCKQGYIYVKKFYKINRADQVIEVDEDKMVTSPTSPTPRSAHTRTTHSARAEASCSASGEIPRSPTNASPRPRFRSLNEPKIIPRHKRGYKKVVNSSAQSYLVPCKRVFVSTLRGTRVIARNDEDGMYYPGMVSQCPNVRHCTVEFADGPRSVLTRFVIPMGGAVPRPPLAVGDYALVQVMNLEQALECFVPAIVQVSPQNRQSQTQFYTLTLYNGQKVTTRRNHLVKISKERYELSARYITAMQGGHRHRSEHRRRSRSSSASLERSRSRSRTPSSSRTRSRSNSSSRSPTPTPRPSNPTPGAAAVPHPSPLPSPDSLRRRIIGKVDKDVLENNERRIKSRSSSASPSRITDTKVKRSRSVSGSRSLSPYYSDFEEIQVEEIKQKQSVSITEEQLAVGSQSGIPRSSSRSGSSPPTTSASQRQQALKQLLEQMKEQGRRQKEECKRLMKMVKKMWKMKRDMKENIRNEILDDRKKEQEKEKACIAAEVQDKAPLVTPRLMRLRRSLPALQAAEEVLARFSDDGWYYRGMVQQNLGDYSYIVEDATGYIERIWREDIISDYDDNAPPLKEGDRVVAQHPCHTGSYAPGCVVSIDEVLQTVEIKFYDGHQGAVPRAEVYRLAREKYNHDVLHIQRRQRAMLGLSVVARDDNSGEYYPGQVVEVEEGGHRYVVRGSDGSQVKQLPVHVFSAMTRRPRLLVGDRVLAIAHPELVIFLPGQIVGMHHDSMVVRFCDGQVRDDISPEFCYWLSNGYHEEASYFWKISQPTFGLEP